jgi:hypothetical protein
MRTVSLLAAACLALTLPPAAAAQVGGTTDIIAGTVTGADGRPLSDVVIEAFSLETQITRRAATDARGRYTILFPDGGGQYRMTARVVGMAPRQAMLMRQADEDRLIWNVSLASNPVTLEQITVRGNLRLPAGFDPPTPGSTERAYSTEQLARLPIDVADLAAMATLAPGVIPIGATDSSAASFSVAGMSPEANAITLDGLLFGAGSVPQDAVRQTRVITSTYDVARGQFSGGLVAATTRGGSNVVQGSSQYQLRDEDLSLGEDTSAFFQGFTQHVISGGLGGPVKRDRLFVFGSLQARLRDDPQQTLLTANASDFTRLGINPDSVDRFTDVLSGLMPAPTVLMAGPATRSNDNLSALGRMDVVLSGTHSMTLRGDWRGTTQDPSRLGPLALPQTGGSTESGGGGVMLTLSSRFTTGIINELRGYWQTSRSDGAAYIALPQGRVQVASELPDSSFGIATLAFGGNSGLPTRSRSRGLELTNELSWIPPGGGHRIKLGGLFLSNRATSLVAGNRLGTFTYQSLAALEAGRPSVFTRTLEDAERVSSSLSWAFYAGDVWMMRRPLQLTYGVRVEGGAFREAPDYNPAVETTFGRRTDRTPSEWHLSPRVGFTYTIRRANQPRPGEGFAMGQQFTPPALIIRGGVGEFRSPLPANLVAQARSATGLANSAAELQCIGAAVPTPDWGAYLANPASIPEQCDGGGVPVPPNATAPRTVLVIGDGFQAPRAWRGSLAFERSLTQLLRASLEGSFARGVRQTGYVDLNLDDTPDFTLAAEGGRPVFVAPSQIAAASGTPRFTASRVDSTFGRVNEARSAMRSRTTQLTMGLGGIVGRGIVLQSSYTWQRVRDEATGARGGSTGGDPNRAEWARSALERRHNMLLTLTYPLSPALEVTTIGRLMSGSPYTPMVAGDVNGDGSWNDRAFITAPGTGSAEAQAMQGLLARAAPRVRDCLLGQSGRVAARNSCTGPWQGTLDLQLNWRPAQFGLNRRLMISVVTVNFLHGLDQLLHSPAGEKGWGLTPRPDGNLLYVTGFDTVGQRYLYRVNERFGATAGSANAFRPPFQVGVSLRLQIGPDRMRPALDAMRGRGGAGGARMGGPGGGARLFGSPADLMRRLDSMAPNPARIALELRDTILLDTAQVTRLTALRDSLDARNQARMDTVLRAVQREGTNANPERLFTTLRPVLDALRQDRSRAVQAVQAVLTPVQWARVSLRLRPQQGPGDGAGDAGRYPLGGYGGGGVREAGRRGGSRRRR